MQPAKATKPQRGYNVLPWRMVGMNYSPISEVSEDDLRKFAAAFQMQRICPIEVLLARAAAPNQIAVVLASREMSRLIRVNDVRADPAIVSRFLSRETAHHCALVILATRRAESAFH